jgi:GNAT superfamily N-acetyltransferase
MQDIRIDFSATNAVKASIKTNWEHYHYCLGRSPSVELSIGRYLTWLITSMPDHFMNLVVCTQVPSEGIDELIGGALDHFRSLNIGKVTWLAQEGVPATEIKKYLVAHGLTFRESFAIEMAADLSSLPDNLPAPIGLRIVPVIGGETLKQWIHVASIGFGVREEYEKVWYDFFVEAIYDTRFRTYLAFLDGQPVATSQLFLSAGVAGIYNVTCIPDARRQGIGAAITSAPLLEARKRGYQVGILQASEVGARVYRRLGFQDFGGLSVYLWENK